MTKRSFYVFASMILMGLLITIFAAIARLRVTTPFMLAILADGISLCFLTAPLLVGFGMGFWVRKDGYSWATQVMQWLKKNGWIVLLVGTVVTVVSLVQNSVIVKDTLLIVINPSCFPMMGIGIFIMGFGLGLFIKRAQGKES